MTYLRIPFHVKQKPSLTFEQKNLAFLGFQKGSKKVKTHVNLATIERSGNELCFTVVGNESGVEHIPVSRIFLHNRWIDAIFRPYLSGQEAGEIAANWWTRNGQVGSTDELNATVEIDPDFVKWKTCGET